MPNKLVRRISGRDMRYCPECGQEYDALNTVHTCDERDLEMIEMAREGHDHSSTGK